MIDQQKASFLASRLVGDVVCLFIYRDKFTACKDGAVEKALDKRGPSQEPDGGNEHHAHLTTPQEERERRGGARKGCRSKRQRAGIRTKQELFPFACERFPAGRWSTNNSGDDEGHHSNVDER